MTIEENVDSIKKDLYAGIKIVGVSKTRTIEEIESAYNAGIRDFGENKVQEFLKKYDNFHKDVKWHLIGHLQTNKVKYIVGKVNLIQSLDSVKLLTELEKRYKKADLIADTLIEINIGKEESKTGIYEENLQELICECEKCSNVKVHGLMCVIPKGNEEQCKNYFKRMKSIYDTLGEASYKNITMEILSMGMSHDYKYAIKEGSNMVRIGQGIFGPRNYK